MGHFRTTAAEEVNGHRCTLLGYLLEIFFLFGWIRKILDISTYLTKT